MLYLPKEKAKSSYESGYQAGYFYGVVDGSDMVLIGSKNGTLAARSFKRLPSDACRDGPGFLECTGTPWSWTPETGVAAAGGRVLMDAPPVPGELPPPPVREEVPVPRQLYARKVDLQRFGYTQGCPGCLAASGGTQPRAHTVERRERIQADLEKAGESGRVEASRKRQNV